MIFLTTHLFKRKKELIPPKLCVVGFHHGCSDLRAAPNREGDLALLAVIHGQAFQHQATKAGSSTTTAGIVYAETLQTCKLKQSGLNSDEIKCYFRRRLADYKESLHHSCFTQHQDINEYAATRNRMVFFNIRPVQLSASLRILSNTKSTISLPIV